MQTDKGNNGQARIATSFATLTKVNQLQRQSVRPALIFFHLYLETCRETSSIPNVKFKYRKRNRKYSEMYILWTIKTNRQRKLVIFHNKYKKTV